MGIFRYVGAAVLAATLVMSASADTAGLFGAAPETADAQLSPDGKYIALQCAPNGAPAACIYPLSGDGKPQLFQLSDDQRLNSIYWASDEHLIVHIEYFERLQTGEGIWEVDVNRLISYNIETGKNAMLMKQAGNFFNLTDINSICDKRKDKVMMELTTYAEDGARTGRRTGRRDAGFRTTLYAVDLDNGRVKVAETGNASIYSFVLDRTCEPVVRELYNDVKQTYGLQMVDGRKTIFELTDVPVKPAYAVGMNADETAVIIRADHGKMRGLYNVPLDGSTPHPVTVQGIKIGDPSPIMDTYTDTVIGYGYVDDMYEQYFTDPVFRSVHDGLKEALPDQTITLTSWTRDRSLISFKASAPGRPAQFYLFDQSDSSVSPLGAEAPQLADAPLGEVISTSYTARDGTKIPAYLTLPAGKTKDDGPAPLILMPHGGPEARDTAAYDWWAQAYAAEGYAVLQPNFRGSDGYGAAFRNAGFGEFGAKMIDDVLDGIAWAQQEGYAKSEGVCVIGASYGGYSALMAPLRDDGEVHCVVAVNAVTDIFNHMSRYDRESDIYRYWARYVGSDVFSNSAARRPITPVNRASEYDVPVLLIHAREDTTVEVRQGRKFKEKWGRRDGLRYVETDGQDHYLRTSSAREEVLRESISFLNANHPAR